MAQLIILIGRLVDLEWTFVGHIKRTAIGLPPILQIYHGHVLCRDVDCATSASIFHTTLQSMTNAKLSQ